MTKQELLGHIQEVMQTQSILKEENLLADIDEWDSLTIIAMINLYKELFGIVIEGRTFNECKSVKDLMTLVEQYLDL